MWFSRSTLGITNVLAQFVCGLEIQGEVVTYSRPF